MSIPLRESRIDWSRSSSLDERLGSWANEACSQSRLVTDEPLSRHSSLRIGGPAKYWIEVGTADDLRSLVRALAGARWHCVGLGSNTLFPDDGIDAPVIRLVGELAKWSVRPTQDSETAQIDVWAGAINAHLVRGLLSEGWIGAEFLTLIPGTFGGAVALNAGTKEKELKAILTSVLVAVVDRNAGQWRIERRSVDQLAMSYRHAELESDALVVAGCIELERGDVDEARRRVKADKERRNRTQPYRLASVGSTFANPEGDFAGRLIEAVGLKGEAAGGARISSLHANFFINESDATATDFLRLMALARHRVRQQFDIELRPEVKFVGFDGYRELSRLESQLDENDV